MSIYISPGKESDSAIMDHIMRDDIKEEEKTCSKSDRRKNLSSSVESEMPERI